MSDTSSVECINKHFSEVQREQSRQGDRIASLNEQLDGVRIAILSRGVTERGVARSLDERLAGIETTLAEIMRRLPAPPAA